MKKIKYLYLILITPFFLALQVFSSVIPSINLSDYELEQAIRTNNLEKVKENISILKNESERFEFSSLRSIIHLKNELNHAPLETAIFMASELPIIQHLVETVPLSFGSLLSLLANETVAYMRWNKPENLTAEQKKQYRINVALLLLKKNLIRYSNATCKILQNIIESNEPENTLHTHYFLLASNPSLSKEELHPIELLTNLEIINIDYPNTEGKTILHRAVESYNVHLMIKAIKCNAQFTTLDKEENTPLHYASQLESYAPLKALLDHGASSVVTVPNKKGSLPLHIAVTTKKDPLWKVQALGKYNLTAQLTHKDYEGDTPLHIAIRYSKNKRWFFPEKSTSEVDPHTKVVWWLLARENTKSIINYKNNMGKTPLDEALTHSNPEIQERLMDLGATTSIQLELTKKPECYLK